MECIILMIVVAIIGILAASSCRTIITDIVQNAPVANLGTALTGGCSISPTKYVTSGNANADGVITVVANHTALGGDTASDKNSISLIPMVVPGEDEEGVAEGATATPLKAALHGGKTIQGWQCGPATNNPMPNKYLPGSCQGTY